MNITNFPLSEIATICILYFSAGEIFENIPKCVKLSDEKKLLVIAVIVVRVRLKLIQNLISYVNGM